MNAGLATAAFAATHLRLAPGVHVVDGAVCSCLYDLRHEYVGMYHLGGVARGLLHEVLASPRTGWSTEENSLASELIEFGVVEWCDARQPPADLAADALVATRGAEALLTTIEVTSRCDLDCPHCVSDCRGDGASLSEPDVARVVQEVADCGFQEVVLCGGEPLLAFGTLRSLVERLRAAGIERLTVWSNGQLLDDSAIDWLRDHRLTLAVTVYGASPEAYAGATGRDTLFHRHRWLFPRLERAGVDYRASLLRLAVNEGDSLADVSAALSVPLSRLVENQVGLQGRNATSEAPVQLLPRRRLHEDHFRRPLARDEVTRQVLGHACYAGRIHIDAALEVYPCWLERRSSYGNLRERPLRDLLVDRGALRRLTKDSVEVCCDCEYRYACRDCRPASATANLLSKPWYCDYDPRKGEWPGDPRSVRLLSSGGGGIPAESGAWPMRVCGG